jgi:hypothetical protein
VVDVEHFVDCVDGEDYLVYYPYCIGRGILFYYSVRQGLLSKRCSRVICRYCLTAIVKFCSYFCSYLSLNYLSYSMRIGRICMHL